MISRGGSYVQLQYLLVVSTCVLYLVAAGLFSRSVWFFEAQKWSDAIGSDAAETGSGPGSYDISKSVWHLNVSPPCLHPLASQPRHCADRSSTRTRQ
jgi:high-affinity iron transporter